MRTAHTDDADGVLPKLGELYADGFYMGETDGAAIFINSKTKKTTIRALITPGDR